MAAAVKRATMPQSTGTRPTYASDPAAELIAITSSEVPAACFIGRPPNSTSAGTNRKPPPTPSRPVSTPMAAPVPALTIRARVTEAVSGAITGRLRRSIDRAAAAITTASAASCMPPVTHDASRAPM